MTEKNAMLELADRLQHATVTAQNDDLSEPRSEKRQRHSDRIDVMLEAIAALRASAGAEPVAYLHECKDSAAEPSLSFAPARNSAQWTSEPLYRAAPAPASVRDISDEDMRNLLSSKDVGTGRGRLKRILTALSPAPEPTREEIIEECRQLVLKRALWENSKEAEGALIRAADGLAASK